MSKVFAKMAIVAAAALVALCAVGCTSGSSGAASGSSSASNAVQLDGRIEQGPLTYSVNSQWKQSGGATGQNSSEYKFATGEGSNALTVKVEDPTFASSPSDELEKMRVSWVDYQGATNWQASGASRVKVGNNECTVYQCAWKLKNGTSVNMKVGYIPTPNGFVAISYFYDTGDAAIFDAVLSSMSVNSK